MLQSNDDWPFWKQELEHDDIAKDADKPERETPKEHPRKQFVNNSDHKTTAKKRIENGTNFSQVDLMRYASLGTDLLAAVLVGVSLMWALSWLIGLVTGYRPTWLIAIGVVLGAVTGFLNMYRFVVDENKKQEQKRRGSSDKKS